ncbi:isopenicillin N synthase family oxygenase [Corallococcus sp. AB018]|uniref:isopenicillin N synthase family dioxygenase n=1 Tax=Corallococcus sp. AB018 TaxID=2316715 RepID=UPI000F891DCA|nr:2OG-Fe(II) oxygenase family protein [Corallococcus sp. AB018]RUO93035.1 isopenicillin N synthase family oxygenase [Corallococcus sp. AB018]
MDTVPLIDVRALVDPSSSPQARREVAARMGAACRNTGFFYVVGHGVDVGLQTRLEALARDFFARPEEEKQRVRAGTPLHGPNLFPLEPDGLGGAVLAYMAALTSLGHTLMSGIALSLDLEADFFAARYMADPTVLFRIFNYPPGPEVDAQGLPVWGVGEHTDYGVLTILKQDDAGGLQVKTRQDGHTRWVDAPPVEDAFVCNIGDMLDRMTRGVYRSTPHRVLNRAGRDRLSLPFFFDPDWTAEIAAIDSPALKDAGADDHAERWDRQSVHSFRGTYGAYLLGKVGKVFPDLRAEVL